VRQKNSGKIVTTYACYDNGSSGCFITERLKNQMNAVVIETSLQLGTMHDLSFINSHVLNELVVTDLNDNNDIELRRTYTREQITIDYQQIPTPEVVGRFENLNAISKEISERFLI
jgi:hypothetical protein